MPTIDNEDQDLPSGQTPGAISDDAIETDDGAEPTSENVSEVVMRINLLGKLVIPPPAP